MPFGHISRKAPRFALFTLRARSLFGSVLGSPTSSRQRLISVTVWVVILVRSQPGARAKLAFDRVLSAATASAFVPTLRRIAGLASGILPDAASSMRLSARDSEAETAKALRGSSARTRPEAAPGPLPALDDVDADFASAWASSARFCAQPLALAP